MKYVATIGLEIHAELKTASKMFCSCKNDPDEEKPNTNVCPICLGHPGTLPVINIEAVKHVLKVGLAVGGRLADFTEWDRKNYFYPDIPKGYQISQYTYPLVSDGELAGVALERIHLEEDTAQSTHDQHAKSLINFNRSGVPLMELVTKPVIHDAETAVRFAKELQLLLRTLSAGEANLEKGEMRVEANISIALNRGQTSAQVAKRSDLSTVLGTKTEVKNLNSFRSVERAIEFEIERQSSLLEAGEQVIQETRGWDDGKNETYSQRSKESSHDYRYFPEPDIPKLKLSEIREFSADALRKELPELPWVKRDRYKKDFGMTDKEIAVFVESPKIAEYFKSVISLFGTDAKKIRLTINVLLNSYLGKIYLGQSKGKENIDSQIKVDHITSRSFAEIVELISGKLVSSSAAGTLIDIALTSKVAGSMKALAEQHGLIQKNDTSDLAPAIDKVLIDHAKAVGEYRAGKTASLQFLIGQVMKATRGAGNPEIVKKILLEKLA